MTDDSTSTSLSSLIKSLCEESKTIRNHLCSVLSKSKFENIVVTDMCGSGNNKVRKDYLSKNIIDLLQQIEKINECINPVLNCDNLSEVLVNICDSNNNQFQSNINSQIAYSASISDAVDKAMKLHSSAIEQKLSELQNAVSKLNVTSDINYTPTSIPECAPDIVQDKCHVPDVTPPEPAFYGYRDGVLTPEEEGNIIEFLYTVDFVPENGHGVKKFGARYHYSGAADAAEDDIPAELNVVLEKVKALYPNANNINQCLVNCYKGKSSKLPEHSDDELCIDPESSIFTISLGQDRTIIFRDKSNDNATPLVAKGRSLYTMTRSSQTYYSHRIDEEHGSTLRFSLTFRTVGQQFRKSTIIIGDSNSKYLMFGEGQGTFGKGQPGKRVRAAVVSDIDPHDCAAYANVVLMVGTNNLRQRYISSRADVNIVFENLKEKIDTIRLIRKDIKIILLPVLPTRLSGMNRQIQHFNYIVFNYFISSGLYFNVSMPTMNDIEKFFDSDNLLNRAFLRNSTNQNDAVHLNSRGLIEIAFVIKSQIFLGYRRKSAGGPKALAPKASSGQGNQT